MLPSAVTDQLVLNGLAGGLLPLLVSLLTRWSAPAWFKAVVNLLLSAIAGVALPIISAGTEVQWRVMALSVMQVFVVSIVTHYGLFKPAGVTGSDGAINDAVPGGLSAGTPDPAPVA